jgi:hypothetical protein
MEIPQFVEKALGFSQIEEADFSVGALLLTFIGNPVSKRVRHPSSDQSAEQEAGPLRMHGL